MDYEDKDTLLMYGDCLERMKEIPDGSVDLVLTDPPYTNMVSEAWDRKSEDYYDNLFEKMFEEVSRVLRYGGRLVVFGSNDTLKYYYNKDKMQHRELLIVPKEVETVSGGRNTKKYKQHVNCCEYVYVSTKSSRPFVRDILLKAKNLNGLTSQQINEKLGVKTNGGGMWSIYTGDNKCAQVPTEEKWLDLQDFMDITVPYEAFEEYFENDKGLSNILDFYNFRFKNRKHPTQKPVELMEYLVTRYSRGGSKVLDLFMGSGTTCVACKNLGRKFIGIEMDEKYFSIAKERIVGEENCSCIEPYLRCNADKHKQDCC